MFKKLDKYNKIGLDFDNTLIGNKVSDELIRYVLNNTDKEYHIVTFRTKKLADEIPDKLLNLYNVDFFNTNIIKSIQCLPNTIYFKYYEAKVLNYGNNHPYIKQFYGWKADICKEMGIEVLIDDNINVKESLDINNISYIKV